MQYDYCNLDSRKEELTRVSKKGFENGDMETINAPITLMDLDFEQALRRHHLLIVEFFAPWCGPCIVFAPIIEQLASEMAGKAVFGRLNADENPKITSLFEVQSVPTVIMFKNGELVDGFRGVAPKTEIKTMIETIMSL